MAHSRSQGTKRRRCERSGRGLLLVGISTRALAASVRRAGFRGPLAALDFFGDADQERLCRCLVPGRDLPGPRTVATLLRAALGLSPSAVVFSGGIETHPRLLRRLETRLRVLGNRALAVRAVRDPGTLFRFLDEHGLPHPRTWTRPDPAGPAGLEMARLAGARRLLWKPRHGGGGMRIRRLDTPPAGSFHRGYVQERVAGLPGSVAFVADGRRARVLGYCRILSGERALGARGFAYSGNLWGPPRGWLPDPARTILARAAALLARHFGLRGLNGIDFVLRDGVPFLLEVNPRYTASMELIEEGWERSLYALHREACLGRALPALPGRLEEGAPAAGWLGKGIVYARAGLRVVSPQPFLRSRARDIPRAGTRVRAGWPLCTVIARAATAGACRDTLLERAAMLRRALAARARAWRAS